MCNRRHICIVPCHRERIVPNTCQPPGERSPRYCTRRLPQSRQWETEGRVCHAIPKHHRVDCREHLIDPSDSLRSEQDVYDVAGNASPNPRLMSTIAALFYSTLVPSNFRPESISYNVALKHPQELKIRDYLWKDHCFRSLCAQST